MFLLIIVLLLIPFVLIFLMDNHAKYQKILFVTLECFILLIATIVVIKKLAISIDYSSIINYINGKISYSEINKFSICSLITLIFSMIMGYALKRKEVKNNKKTLIIYVLCLIAFSSSLLIMLFSYNGNKNIRITEICGSVDTEYVNYEDGQESDVSYVKLYNNSNYTCLFDKLFLSTNIDELFMDSYESIEIEPYTEYVLFVNSSKLDLQSSKSSYLYLSSNQYNKPIDQVEFPSLKNNEYYVVSSKIENGTIKSYSEKEETAIINKPTFTINGGFYNDEFDVYINIENGYDVYYTLDSSNPTKNSIKYNGEPIHVYDRSKEKNIYRNIKNVTMDYMTNYAEPENVDKCFILRAIAYDSKGNSSKIETQSYFVNLDKYKNNNVISLVSDPDDLFGDDGIYVTGKDYDDWYKDNFKYLDELIGKYDSLIEIERKTMVPNFRKRGIDNEVKGNMELYNSNHCDVNQTVGVRIQGNYSSFGGLKRFSVYSREKYNGSNVFDGKVLDDNNIHSIVFRDSESNYLVSKSLRDRDLAHQKCDQAVVFLDGEYWYSTFMYEKYSKTKFNKDYGLLKDNVIFNQFTDNEIYNVIDNEDMSQNDNYEILNGVMDIQSYIDFEIATTYFNNCDYREWHNTFTWKSINKENNNKYGDCRWRWAIYDSDVALVKDSNTISFLSEYNNIHNALKNNEIYVKDFTNTYMDMINSYFSPKNIEPILERLGYDLSYENNFFVERPKYITKYLEEEFNLKGTQEEVKLSTNKQEAGTIILNTIKPDLQNVWSGKYYTDYPIELEVQENEGYNFLYWEVNGKYYSDDLLISVNIPVGGVNIVAIYE